MPELIYLDNAATTRISPAALDAMRADGTYQKIYDKWFGSAKAQ